MDIGIKLSAQAIKQIKDRYSTYDLSKYLNHDLASRLLKGDANITLRNFVKLCILMDWDIPPQLEVIQKNNNTD